MEELALATTDQEIIGELLSEVASCLVRVDQSGTFVEWPEGCKSLLEYEAGETVGKMKLPDLFADPARGHELIAALEEHGRGDVTGELVRKSGGSFMAQVVLRSDNNGSYLGIVRDVSQHEQAQENFDCMRMFLDTIMEISGDAIITADTEGVIVMFNEGAEAIFKKGPFDALGEDMFSMLFLPALVPAVKEALKRDGYVRDRESIIKLDDGDEVYLEVTISKRLDLRGQEAGLIAIIRDMTTKRRLDEERIQGEAAKHEMRLARGVQLTMLPESPPKIEGLDIAAKIEFCDDIGGDLFDFSRLANGKLGVSIGDVSDHGVAPAIVMSSAKAMINALEQYTDDIEQMAYMLNNLLEQSTESERFITAFYGQIDPHTRSMTYVNAGHDPPIILRAATGDIEELDSNGLPLGMMTEEHYEMDDPVTFASGDLLLLATDGLMEAMNADDEQFGKPRMIEVLRELQDEPSEAILEEIFVRVREHLAGARVRDDQTAVLIKFE